MRFTLLLTCTVRDWCVILFSYIYTHTHTHRHIYIYGFFLVYNFCPQIRVCMHIFGAVINSLKNFWTYTKGNSIINLHRHVQLQQSLGNLVSSIYTCLSPLPFILFWSKYLRYFIRRYFSMYALKDKTLKKKHHYHRWSI